MTDAAVKELICQVDPENQEAITLREGQNATVYLTRQYAVRVPKNQLGLQNLRAISPVAKAIADRLPIPISQPKIVHLKSDQILLVSLERRFAGEPLSPDRFQSLPDAEKEQVIGQLKEFLQELHHLPPTFVKNLDLPKQDDLQYWMDFYHKFHRYCFGLIPENKWAEISRRFDEFLNDDLPTYFGVRHGDFGGSNIIYCDQQQRVTGIVDLETLALGDPIYDYASLSTLGLAIEDLFPYSAIELSFLQKRMLFYRYTFAMQEALMHALDGKITLAYQALREFQS